MCQKLNRDDYMICYNSILQWTIHFGGEGGGATDYNQREEGWYANDGSLELKKKILKKEANRRACRSLKVFISWWCFPFCSESITHINMMTKKEGSSCSLQNVLLTPAPLPPSSLQDHALRPQINCHQECCMISYCTNNFKWKVAKRTGPKQLRTASLNIRANLFDNYLLV